MAATNTNDPRLAVIGSSPIESMLMEIDDELQELDNAVNTMQKRTVSICINTVKDEGVSVSMQQKSGSSLLVHLEDVLKKIRNCKTIVLSNIEQLQI